MLKRSTPRIARDHRYIDPGIEKAIDEGIAWLGRAQDQSASQDGGVASHFSLVKGWSTSYPETTGYIVPTMLAYAKLRGEKLRAPGQSGWLIGWYLSSSGRLFPRWPDRHQARGPSRFQYRPDSTGTNQRGQ